jgi:hypothetical protein
MGVTERVLAQACPPLHHVHARLDELRLDVPGLGQRELLDPVVHRDRIHLDAGQTGRADAEALVVPIAGHHVRAGDEGLGRDAVGEHARTAGAVGLDERDVRVQLGGHQRRLVAARSAADDHNPAHTCPHFVESP